MKIRWLLIFTGIVSSLLGALVVYLVLSVPNDLRADALLKQARQDITDGQNAKARGTLLRIVQQYPRTDAAAAATAALVALEKRERDELARAVITLSSQHAQQAKVLADLQKNLIAMKNAPPNVVTVQAPAPKPAPAKKAAPKKNVTTKKRRR
jgi:hypothetical protein